MILPLWTCDPALAALFTPRSPLMGRYEACTTSESLETASGPATDDVHLERPETLDALDAFGEAGPYRRSVMARLYGGTRVRVTRGWTLAGGRCESITLLSPHPDASLTRLLPGTLVIRWIVQR